ncbi:MAG: hypothetical protein JW719_06510 [Pirellulales bacterium]|nr:hypothetical protein [Pirellulales bacterium]
MTTQKSDSLEPTTETVHLKDPALAALLAWLIPGLGHFYQGRWAKAVLLFVCIMGTFVYGLYLGSDPAVGWGRVVYWTWQPGEKRLYYFCQIGVGLPAVPAIIQAIRVHGGEGPMGTFMAPPFLGAEKNAPPGRIALDQIHRRLGRYFELGTIYTAVAGLLNILAIFDAWAGPVIPAPHPKKEDKDDEKHPDDKAPSPADASTVKS